MYLSSGSGTTWTASDHKYSESPDDEDWTHFDSGDRLRIFTPGNEATPQYGTLASAPASGTVIFTSSISGSAPYICEAVDYDDGSIQSTQKEHLFMSDGDGVLDSDQAYRYL